LGRGLRHLDRLLGGRNRRLGGAVGVAPHGVPRRPRVRDAAGTARSVQLTHCSPRRTARCHVNAMALLVAAAAFPARRLGISLTCLLAWRRPAAFAGVGVLISFAPLPALSLVASLTEGTRVATSGTFAQFGVYFLDPRTVSAHMTGLIGTIVREPRPVREGCRGSPRRDGAAGATILPHGASHPVPADRAVRLRVAR